MALFLCESPTFTDMHSDSNHKNDAKRIHVEAPNAAQTDHQHEIAKLVRETEQARKDGEILKQQIEDLIQQQLVSEQRMQERFREIAGLSRLLQERDRALSDANAQAEWLRQVMSVLTMSYSKSFKARLMSLFPLLVGIYQQKKLLKRKGLFSSEDYTDLYPDISGSGIDPLRHYINHGMQEGRAIRRNI